MSLPRLWAFLAVALPTLAALIAPLQSVDLAYQLRAGAEILDARAIPAVDTWTFTAAGLPWTDQQWGAQVILAAVYQVAGWTGLVLARGALVAVVFACLFVAARRLGLPTRAGALLVLAAFAVTAAALALRPQLLGMALFAVVLLLIADRHRYPRRLWAIPIIVVLWANVHGSFFLAPLVLGLAWLEDVRTSAPQRHEALRIAIASVLAACVTPFGPWVWAYAVGLSTNPEVRRLISEWQPTSPTDVTGLLFYASAVGVAGLVLKRRRSVSWPTLLWLVGFFIIGAYAARGVAWWGLAATVPVAGLLAGPAGAVPGARSEFAGTQFMRRLNIAVAALIVLAGVAVLPIWRPVDPAIGAPRGVIANAPPGITDALRAKAHSGDRLLPPQVWGSWFEFALPDVPVAIDSRVEFIPPEVWERNDAILSGTGDWAEQLTRWGVTIAIVQPGSGDLGSRLQALGWSRFYDDPDGSIFLAPGR